MWESRVAQYADTSTFLSGVGSSNEAIRLQMYYINGRQQNANAKRNHMLKDQLDHQANYGEKLTSIKHVKDQMNKDKELEVLNKVVLKHYTKEKVQRKKSRDLNVQR